MSINQSRRSPPFGPWTRFEPSRSVTAEGFRWRIYEVSDQMAPSGRSLIFEHELAWRRLRDYPANWAELPDAVLVALLTAP